MGRGGRAQFVPCRRSSSKAVWCLPVPIPPLSALEFEVSETLFILWRWREVFHGMGQAPLGFSKVVRSRAMNSNAPVSLQPLPLEGKEIFHCELTPAPCHPWRI